MGYSFHPRFTISNRIASDLARIERARGFLEGASLSESWLAEMGERALVREAHHTTHIEGTRLTLDESERLLAGEDVASVDPEDARELLNYRRGFELVSNYLETGGRITEGLVREIHRRLVEGVRGGSAAPGEYRELQNYVVNSVTGETVYTPPPAFEVPILMAELVEWINSESEVHPVLVSGIAQFQLVHIHPFLDGNGRTSRLLSTLCLYRAGYDFKRLFSISEYYDRDRTTFYRAIQSVREQGMDMTSWLEYFTVGLSTQLAEVQTLGERKLRQQLAAETYSLTERQKALLGVIAMNNGASIQQLASAVPGVSRRSLQRDLKRLQDIGLVLAEGSTNRVLYRTASPPS